MYEWNGNGGSGDGRNEMTEAQLARLESDVARIRWDMADLKTGLRELRREIGDARLRDAMQADRLEARRYETWSRIVTWLLYAMIIVALARASNWI
jgi:hypothetical protein